jgi:hypothetical protein
MLDVGLMQRLAGLPIEVELARKELLDIHNGAVAEQFVGQELTSAAAGNDGLHYWSRAAKNSSAEVDYLTVIGTRVRPLEVKSGSFGSLRSLHVFLGEHPECAPGIVLSEAPCDELREQKLLFVPLYFAGSLRQGELISR